MDAVQTKLDALKAVLQDLQAGSLPAEALAALQRANQHLADLDTALEAEDERMLQAIQEAEEAKARFISVVTHELRIPLTSIKGYTDLMRQGAVGPVNEQQVDFLVVIRNNVERMSRLISGLSDLSKLETGRLRLECSFLSLLVSVEHALHGLQPEIKERGQSLEIDVASDLPEVYADPNRLEEVIWILVNNAYTYTPGGGVIRVTAEQQGDFLRVEVSDNGIGISPEDQEQVFSQFFRSEDLAVREKQGWGLGLAVAKQLVERMGGEMGLKSELGQGSTFWFTSPLLERECNE